LGEVRLARAYYYCPACRAGRCPQDAALRLGAGDLTPAARELTALAGTRAGFAEAAEKVLPKLAGLRLAESTAERTTEAAGAELGGRLAAGEVFGPDRAWDWSRDAAGRTVAYVSVDATGVGMQGPGGSAAEGRMADVGLVFDAARPGRTRPLAGLYALPERGAPLRRQGAQVGMDRAEGWVALTDGGAGLDEFMRVYFPRAELVLDFSHAAEHLNDLAKAWRPGDEAAARAGRVLVPYAQAPGRRGAAGGVGGAGPARPEGGGAGGAPAGGRVHPQQRGPDGLPALPGQRLADRVGARGGGVQGGGRPAAQGQRHALE
jgi:hypothetical protein